jgi:hypothetical protein
VVVEGGASVLVDAGVSDVKEAAVLVTMFVTTVGSGVVVTVVTFCLFTSS